MNDVSHLGYPSCRIGNVQTEGLTSPGDVDDVEGGARSVFIRPCVDLSGERGQGVSSVHIHGAGRRRDLYTQ